MEAIDVPTTGDGGTAALVPSSDVLATSLVTPAAPLAEIEQAFHAYEALCTALLTDDDHQTIGNRRFRKRTAWRKLAVAYGVSVELTSREYERDASNRILRAEVSARAIAPNGRHMDGIGACDVTERCCDAEDCTNTAKWHKHCPASCTGFRHFSKPGHDIPATAHTRAVSRACSDLFGLGEVSAEEVSERDVHHEARRSEPEETAAPPPEGYPTHETAIEAHALALQKIKELPDGVDRAPLKAYRDEKGWPMAKADLDELVRRTEEARKAFVEQGEGRPFAQESAADAQESASGDVDGASTPGDAPAALCAACKEHPVAGSLDGVDLCQPCLDEEARIDAVPDMDKRVAAGETEAPEDLTAPPT